MKWDPLRDLISLRDRLGRLDGREAGWNPPMDVYETPDRYVVTAELPGLTRDQIRIELHDSELTVAGHRPEPGVPADAYQQMERLQGPFARTFVFGDPVDGDGVTAEFSTGVLCITVPKARRPAPKRVDVT
jgi:HSP20 family protein